MATEKVERTSIITREMANAYWNVVLECLLQFHGFSKSQALDKIWTLRQKIENPPPDIWGEIFYHSEPFDVANDIAGNPLDFLEYRERYIPILLASGW